MGIKESTQEKIEAQIKLWGSKIDQLKLDAEKLEAGARDKLLKNIEKIQTQKSEAQNKLTALKSNSTEAWEELQAGVEKSVEDLRSSVAKALDKVRGKK